MAEWYNHLDIWQQWCLWGIIVFSAFGVLRLLYLCYHTLWYDKRLVVQYINNADIFAKKFRSNKNNSGEGEFIIRKSEEVSRILGEDVYDMPALDYASAIKYANIYNAATLYELVRKIYSNYLRWDESMKSQRLFMLLQLLLPFVFWPFRGVESLLIMLSELLHAMGISSLKSESKLIFIVSVIVGIVSFVGSVASILSLFGISISHIVN